jgi:uncharacterized protein (TIGR02145 family)
MKKNPRVEILCIFSLTILTIVNKLNAQDGNTIKDRDGNIYKTVKIGKQTWIAENLKTTRFRDGKTIPFVTDSKEWSNLSSSGYCWYNNDTAINKKELGALYNWYTITSGNICPSGFHVPCDEEWTTLIATLGGSKIAGSKMKEKGIAHWNIHDSDVTNETGLTLLPGGYRLDNGTFSDIGKYCYQWSSTELFWDFNQNYTHFSWGRYLSYYLSDVYRYYFNKKYGFSVRCLKDSVPSVSTIPVTTNIYYSSIVGGHISSDSDIPVTERGVFWGTSQNPAVTGIKLQIGTGKGLFQTNLTGLAANTTYYVCAYAINGTGTAFGEQISFTTPSSATTVKDVEDNVYKIVTIGSQIWMAENLKTTKYNTGVPIPQVTNATSWNDLSTPAYCWYNNDRATYKDIYGALYNWFTVNSGKLCPTGWHVPSDAEWTTLTDYLGGTRIAGAKLKESGSMHWLHPNLGATNETGFKALPGGLIDLGVFNGVGSFGGWWSSVEYKSNYALSRSLHDSENIVGIRYNDVKQVGLSVRCLKD